MAAANPAVPATEPTNRLRFMDSYLASLCRVITESPGKPPSAQAGNRRFGSAGPLSKPGGAIHARSDSPAGIMDGGLAIMNLVRRILAPASVLCLAAGVLLEAQIDTGTILGRILREDGAAAANAQVSLRHMDTNEVADLLSGPAGYFRRDGLRVGKYQLTVALPGFRTEVLRDLELLVGQSARADFQLRRGTGPGASVKQAGPGPAGGREDGSGTGHRPGETRLFARQRPRHRKAGRLGGRGDSLGLEPGQRQGHGDEVQG